MSPETRLNNSLTSKRRTFVSNRNKIVLDRSLLHFVWTRWADRPTHRFLARTGYATISERIICRDSLNYSHLSRACHFLDTKRKVSRYVQCDYDLCS